MNTEKTIVVFRKWNNGDVIALFPTIEADRNGNIMSYMHVGQHGAASPLLVYDTKPAQREEYAALKRELEERGYNLLVRQRLCRPKFRLVGIIKDPPSGEDIQD